MMKPGAAFQMVEEELYWPGTPRDVDVDTISDSESESHLSHSRASSPTGAVFTDAIFTPRPETPSTPRPALHRNTDPPAPTCVPSPVGKRRDPSPKSSFQVSPKRSSLRLPSLSISTMLSSPKPETPAGNHSRRFSTDSESTPSHRRTSFSPSSPATSLSTSPALSPAKPTFPLSAVVHPEPPAPPNPHDHAALEAIYAEMHAQRFVNLAPLSLIANSLAAWFRGVRTHPPLVFTFPPPPTHPRRRSPEPRAAAFDDESGMSDADTSPVGHANIKKHTTETSEDTVRQEGTEADTGSSRFIGNIGLLLGTSSYVYLDDAQFAAFSPSTKASFPASGTPGSPPAGLPWMMLDDAPDPDAVVKALEGLPAGPVPSSDEAPSHMQLLAASLANFKTRLPNPELRMDLRTLNLHLALRTSEILACAEAMWEWVVAFQRERGRPKLGRQLAESVKSTIAELDRADFDALLSQFDM